MAEYKSTFDLSAGVAGTLTTTADKMNPPRTARHAGAVGFVTPANSPRRTLQAVTVTFSVAATQTFTVSIVDRDGTARPINVMAVVAATSAYFEPEHDVTINGKQNFKVDVTATGNPAVTGTIQVFTNEA